MLGLFGIFIGLPVALAATQLFSALLAGVGPGDVPTFSAAGFLLAGVLLAAGLGPA
jgi:hypothetical protein